ncbi:MAG: hypothetical protein EOM07_13085 [Clostridia bacterium]|nr:hypothetical protein [Clostridia bacterium]
MASTKKDIERWKQVTEERYAKVELVLQRNGFLRTSNRGSHFVFRHRTISKYVRIFPEYFHGFASKDGALVIVQHKNAVKRCYLLKAAGMLEKLAEIQEMEEGFMQGQAA